MKAWVYQDDKQVKKHGAEKASWYAGWLDPEGRRRCKSCGPGARGKDAAEKLVRKTEGELLAGTYQAKPKKGWEEFRREYAEKVLAGKAPRTRDESRAALGHFERLVKPAHVSAVGSKTVADFVAARRKEGGLKPGSVISPATVNKELRHLKAALSLAAEWGYLAAAPKCRMEKEPGRLPTFVPPEDFARLYQACDVAAFPAGYPFAPADWWRGLFMTAYLTGWRIGALLSLRREDVDLDAAKALSRAEHNKGKRDVSIPLHPVIVEHLRRLACFEPVVFPWNRYPRGLYFEFRRIQEAAGVKPPPGKEAYGFHDFRRAFATMNADKLTPDALQVLMQHKDYQTTQRYIAMARQMNPAVAGLFVPPTAAPQRTTGAG